MTRNRLVLITCAVVLLLAFADFWSRIRVGRDQATRDVAVPPLAALPTRPGADEIRRDLVTWLPSLAGIPGTTVGASAPDSWRFALLGVFQKGAEPFAVLYAEPSSGGSPVVVRVAVGDVTHGRRVAAINSHSVRLAEGDAFEELVLFKPGDRPVGPPRTQASSSSAQVIRQQTPGPPQHPGARQRPDRERRSRDSARPSVNSGSASLRPQTATAPRAPAAASPIPSSAGQASQASQRSPAGAKVAAPVELQPGQKPVLPWDLPVQAAGAPSGTAGTDKSSAAPAKKQ